MHWIKIIIQMRNSNLKRKKYQIDDVTMMSLYKITDDGKSVAVKSSKLPIFEAKLNNNQTAKTIVNSGAITLYLAKDIAQKFDAKVTQIEPRKVRVANEEISTTTGICTVQMTLGNLPPETITTYVFPLHKTDLILDLS